MAKNIQKCAKCGGELSSFRMELMMGPKGFRSYAVHDEPYPKVLKSAKQKVVGKQRAGVR